MKRALVLLALAACGAPGSASGGLDAAINLYADARFDEAEASLRALLAGDPKDAVALRLLGRILALKNRNIEAATAFATSVNLTIDARGHYTDAVSIEELAWICHRLDDYGRAADWFRVLQDSILETKYREMSGRVPPFTPTWRDDEVEARFPEAELPAIRARVNGTEGTFLIDTGAGELVLDREFARRALVRAVGTRQDMRGPKVEEGIVDQVDIRSLTVRNVPARFSKLLKVDDTAFDGIIGMNFLAHFHVTLDFRRGRLVLRKRGPGGPPAGQEVPVYLAGDRHLLARGQLGIDRQGLATGQVLLQVNTGRPKVAFAPAESALRSLRKMKPEDPPDGVIREAVVGPIRFATDPPKLDSRAFPAGLDFAYGFSISGLVGAEFFKGRVVTIDLERMTLGVD